MSICLDSLDQSYDDQLKSINGLHYLPWVGAHYKSAVVKVMIVAESVHVYEPTESARVAVSQRTFVRLVVSEHGLGFDLAGGPIRNRNLAHNVERCIAGREMSDAERKAFWSGVVYHEHVQRPLSSIDAKRSPQDYGDGARVLRRVVELLCPTVVLYLGTAKSKAKTLEREFDLTLTYHDKVDWAVPKTGRFGDIGLIMIKHPSGPFYWPIWARFFLSRGYEWLNNRVQRRATCVPSAPGSPLPEDDTREGGSGLGRLEPPRRLSADASEFASSVVYKFTRKLQTALEGVLGNEWVVFNEFELAEKQSKPYPAFEMWKRSWQKRIWIGMVSLEKNPDARPGRFRIGVLKRQGDWLPQADFKAIKDLLNSNPLDNGERSWDYTPNGYWVWGVPVKEQYGNWREPHVEAWLQQGDDAVVFFAELFRKLRDVAGPKIDSVLGLP